jgi:hypothetical protein
MNWWRSGTAADPTFHQGEVLMVDNSAAVAVNTALKSGAASLGAVAVTHVPLPGTSN